MLDNLDNIDWSKLKTAQGNASNVPHAIRGLSSEDPTVQESSYWELDNHVVLQSDLFESAVHVVPFLLEILSSNINRGRRYLYDLLYEIANGYATEELSCDVQGEQLPLALACRKAALRGLGLYMKEVSCETSDCRANALELLVSLVEAKETIAPQLAELLIKETDPGFRQQLQESMVELMQS